MSSSQNGTSDHLRTCIYIPPRVNSEKPQCQTIDCDSTLLSSLPMLQMQICLIFFITLFFKSILCRFGIPRFTSMSIVGLIIATTFNKAWKTRMNILFSFDSQENLGLVSELGYMFFLFYVGVKTDMSIVHRTRSGVTNIGSIAIIAPFLCSMAFVNYNSSNYLQPEQLKMLGVIIGLLCMTPFPVVSSILSDLKILNSELGRISQSASLVSEIFNVFIAIMITFSRLYDDFGLVNALISTACTALYILLIIFIIRPAMFWIIKQTPEGSHVSDNYVYSILIITLFSAYVSHRLGFLALFGPFIMGLAIPEGPPLGAAIVNKMDTFVNEIFLPMFVTTCAMRVDLKGLSSWRNTSDGSVDYFMVQTLLIVEVIFVSKFVACMIPSLRSEMPWNDAVSLSLIMSSKGIVEMAGFSMVRDAKGLPDNIFALVMVCIIVNSTLIPMILSYMYDPTKKYTGYIKRNIMDLKSNTELRVLACIHRSDNIPAIINLLEATYPTKEEPLFTYALQLIELIGRAAPIFICHNLQRKNKSNSNTSMAEKIIEAFRSFESEFKDCLVVNTFTAISPSEMMYDDICTLALNKCTALIILPFHLKWSRDGNYVELVDESLRELNYRVMERAPCSVGVLIERAQMSHIFSPETPFDACLLFIGGKDDREALFFTKRMTKNPHVRLTVVRLLALDVEDDSKGNRWESLLDNELLNEIKTKNMIGNVSVKYVEEKPKDGPETATIVRSLVTKFDLIIVGRQAGVETPQTAGFLQWCEYPELGVLGDLLASTDADGKASIFVIQQ